METCDDEVLRLRLTHILLSALTGRPLLTTCGSSARYLKCVYTADGAKSKFVWPTFSRSQDKSARHALFLTAGKVREIHLERPLFVEHGSFERVQYVCMNEIIQTDKRNQRATKSKPQPKSANPRDSEPPTRTLSNPTLEHSCMSKNTNSSLIVHSTEVQ